MHFCRILDQSRGFSPSPHPVPTSLVFTYILLNAHSSNSKTDFQTGENDSAPMGPLVTVLCSKGKKKANLFHSARNVHCKILCNGVLIAECILQCLLQWFWTKKVHTSALCKLCAWQWHCSWQQCCASVHAMWLCTDKFGSLSAVGCVCKMYSFLKYTAKS